MSFQPNFPPSVVAKMAALEEEAGGKRREDYKKLKELEEARKAGTAPAMQDEEGKDINPHIPQYIMQAPWYYAAVTPTLRHQRVQPDQLPSVAALGDWYKKGLKQGTTATKYRKGACENCGSLTHKKIDCLERPRQRGAKFTNADIAPDEFLPQDNLALDFEGKRDRWNGYDMEDHRRVREEFQRIDEAKKELKAQKLDESVDHHEDNKEKGELDDDEKYAEDMDMPGQKFETKQRITVRNLRIREDTAKYLYNLDVNSAYYDPKTRSMRDNPFVNTGKDLSETSFGGDNFVRMSGDAMGIAQRQLFAWEAYEKGADVQLQADPTKLELLAKEVKKRKETHKSSMKDTILDRYGGEEHLDAPPPELLLAQTETYVEYSRHGTVIKGPEKAAVKSRYQEDIYINNHTSVWGSFWMNGQWGFKCCHSLVRESYCTGDAGIEAQVSTIVVAKLEENKEEVPEVPQGNTKKKDKKKKKKRRKTKKKRQSSSSSSSESEEEDDEKAREKKVLKAMKMLQEQDKEAEKLLQMDERKRPYNSMYDEKAPTEEELEAYKRRRIHPDDPMAKLLL